ncbi:Twinfilin-1 [Boothiomyces sp. JEL0866]|nr:Twinfilin-1 [Boothiomyces sp. JEL0866]
MSSIQSGIQPTPELLNIVNSDTNIIQITIENEQLIPKQHLNGTLNDIKSLLNQICFILYKDKDWFLFQYVPDGSLVRDKMMYASSKQALLKGIGENRINEFIYATTPAELTKEGIDKHLISQSAKPLTDSEREKIKIDLQQASSAIGMSTRSTNATGISFPLTQKAIDALNEKIVLLKIENETTDLLSVENSMDFSHKGPFFLYSSSPKLFAFISPPETPIKSRMLYAASRQTILQQLEEIVGKIEKKFEGDSVDEITFEEVVVEKPKGFSRPARPGRK